MFSIIVPAYNYAHFIGECLDSVLAQSHGDWECLVMDNASTDNTEAVVGGYVQRDSRIIYKKLGSNQGPSHARNVALQKAKGDYILFLDADDLVAPEKLAHAAEAFKKHHVDLVFSDYAFFRNSKEQVTSTYCFSDTFKPGQIAEGAVQQKLSGGNVFAISCIITKKSILQKAKGFDEAINYNEDWDLWLRIAIDKAVFYYDDRASGITLIRNHDTSHSKDQLKMYVAGLYVCKKNYDALTAPQKKIFDRKIRDHRYKLKLMLANRYMNDKAAFEAALTLFDKYPSLEDELTFYRNDRWALPAFLIPLYLVFLKINHYIVRKCL